MLFTGRRFHKVEYATKVPVSCTNCSNDVEYELFYAKSGPGLSIPITPFFTDKFTVAAKFFYLVCPICTFGFKVNRAEAKGLGAWVFFFAGYGGKSVILGQSIPILCVNCHNTNPHNILENTKRLSVFFISIVKWEYKYFSVCPVCTRGPELKNKEEALRVIAESFGGVR